jgi:hypothetical protein
MSFSPSDTWITFDTDLKKLRRGISESEAVNVNSIGLRGQTRDLVQFYFRQVRPELQALGIDSNLLAELDESVQSLLKLSNGANPKRLYLKFLKTLSKSTSKVTIAIEFRNAENIYLSRQPQTNTLSGLELIINDTLTDLVPIAALSYKQGLLDLADDNRLSYRGVANELREALRETLDHLAPDEAVELQPNFKFEKEMTTPTMRQKVRFILKTRGLTAKAAKSPEEAIEIVEEHVASLTRATYDRSSISTHVTSERAEVLKVKNYVNVVLAELLALQA